MMTLEPGMKVKYLGGSKAKVEAGAFGTIMRLRRNGTRAQVKWDGLRLGNPHIAVLPLTSLEVVNE